MNEEVGCKGALDAVDGLLLGTAKMGKGWVIRVSQSMINLSSRGPATQVPVSRIGLHSAGERKFLLLRVLHSWFQGRMVPHPEILIQRQATQQSVLMQRRQ